MTSPGRKVEKGCGVHYSVSKLADTLLHMSLPISAGHRSFRASSPRTATHPRPPIWDGLQTQRRMSGRSSCFSVFLSSALPSPLIRSFVHSFLRPRRRRIFGEKGQQGRGKFDKSQRWFDRSSRMILFFPLFFFFFFFFFFSFRR